MLASLESRSRSEGDEPERRASADLAIANDAMDHALARVLDTARINDRSGNGQKWTPSKEERVQEAQKIWLSYREAQCAAEFLAPASKKLEAVNRIWCRTRLTKERTAELNINFIVD